MADSVGKKVQEIFTELVGARAEILRGDRFPAAIASTITAALSGPGSGEEEILEADNIAFHLTDWQAEAAFLVALHLFPERFTPEEIQSGVEGVLIHAPAHVIEAARLAGHSTQNIFHEDTGHGGSTTS